jgi:xylan 1,4-beta-xylosidase
MHNALTIARRECGFEYIRFHGLFTDDMGVYRDYGKPEYNWQYIDELFDFIHSIGMKPFVELGFMPGGLASGSKTIFWWKGNVTPPRDMKKWEDLVRAFVLHVRDRYGDAEVRTWYFRWNSRSGRLRMGNREKPWASGRPALVLNISNSTRPRRREIR